MQDAPIARTLGDFLRAKRTQLRRPMRRFCAQIGIDVSNYSKVERNLIVPGSEMLQRIADGLEIGEGTPEMEVLTDLAATARGRLPDDIAEAEGLKALLPAFYQKLRRAQVNTPSGVYEILLDTIRQG